MEKELPKEIQDIAKKYKYEIVKTIRTPDNGLVRSYILVLRKELGKEDYILKYFWSGSSEARKRFIREIKFLLSRDRYPDNVKKHILSVRYFSFGDGGRGDLRPWFITKKHEGEPLSRFINDLGVKKGLFTINLFESFLNFFISVGDIPQQDLDLWFYDIYHAKNELSHFRKNNPELMSENSWERLNFFIFNNAKEVLSNVRISHLDLYPENTLLSHVNMSQSAKRLNFKIIDWEYVSKAPVAWDPAFMGLLFWREKIWHDRTYGLFYSRYQGSLSKFNLSYRWCTALLGTRFLYQIMAYGNIDDKDRQIQLIEYKTFLLGAIEDAVTGKLVKPDDTRYMISGKIISIILKHYALGTFKSYCLYYLSKGNTVFKVRTSSGSYVVRIYNSKRTNKTIEKEVRLFNYLRDNGVPSYKVYSNSKGEVVTRLKIYGKTRRIVLLSYLRGGSPTRHGIGGQLLVQAGVTLRRMHQLSICHGDYSKRNVLFYKGRVSGVIDLEYGKDNASSSATKKDLAKALALWCMSVSLSSVNIQERVESFLYGYYGSENSPKKVCQIIPKVLQALLREETIHKELYKGGGEGFAVIREELFRLKAKNEKLHSKN
jgi:Ser/Thr protein kinase RdoA (MazF antagonist)